MRISRGTQLVRFQRSGTLSLNLQKRHLFDFETLKSLIDSIPVHCQGGFIARFWGGYFIVLSYKILKLTKQDLPRDNINFQKFKPTTLQLTRRFLQGSSSLLIAGSSISILTGDYLPTAIGLPPTFVCLGLFFGPKTFVGATMIILGIICLGTLFTIDKMTY